MKEKFVIEIIAIIFVTLLHLHLVRQINENQLEIIQLRGELQTTMEMSEWMVNAK